MMDFPHFVGSRKGVIVDTICPTNPYKDFLRKNFRLCGQVTIKRHEFSVHGSQRSGDCYKTHKREAVA